ncbi:MAG: folate-binding protein YgfZ [Bryobacterales bacterium]|nr:folate-binding protein YgfZ [Bryobacterales bacterium]
MAFEIAGYEALRNRAALIDLTGRGYIRATGEDRARLLHAMTTNHIQQLQPGQTAYAFFLSAQGRILADVNVICEADSLVLDTEPETHLAVYQHLDKYIIADDVTLSDETEQMAVLAIEGPESTAIAEQLGLDKRLAPNTTGEWRFGKAAALSVTGQPAVRLYLQRTMHEEARRWIAGLGVVEATANEWHVVRVENAHPRYGADITEAQIPQETQLMHALHFNKGCYLGQEIVERVRSRGHVNKKLAQIEIDGDPDAVQKKVTLDGREVGDITSVVYSPASNKLVALAYLRTEALLGKGQLLCGTLAVRVTERAPQ